jgi:vancomycin resistance protein YoaR
MRNQLWLLMVPPLLYGISQYSYPFGHTLSAKKIPVSSLTTHQKMNIRKAATRIDGVVIRSGEEFSFNKCVGPRTEQTGYYAAPSYVGADTYSSPGGGICVISSALYQDALIAGLNVTQRVPHLKTMQTVEPGFDATVWYGGADLKFVNNTKAAIKIECNLEDGYLNTTLAGDKQSLHTTKISRREIGATKNQVAVEVFQQDGNATRLVSRDLYTISSRRSPQSIANRISWSGAAGSAGAVHSLRSAGSTRAAGSAGVAGAARAAGATGAQEAASAEVAADFNSSYLVLDR